MAGGGPKYCHHRLLKRPPPFVPSVRLGIRATSAHRGVSRQIVIGVHKPTCGDESSPSRERRPKIQWSVSGLPAGQIVHAAAQAIIACDHFAGELRGCLNELLRKSTPATPAVLRVDEVSPGDSARSILNLFAEKRYHNYLTNDPELVFTNNPVILRSSPRKG